MKENIPQLKWRCIGESVKGASHVRSGLPNQDAIRWFPESGIGLPLILAVSDGHGSAKSFRSDRGSRFAVETAIKVIQEFFLSSQSSDINFSALKDAAQRLLPPRLVNEWRKAVNKDLGLSENDEEKLTNKPNFTDEEKQILVDKDGEAAWQAVENNYFLAYGATVLAVLVTEFFIVYIQLGDGDILEVDSKGNTTRPLERDPNLIANETTSLCMNKAWNEFQVHIKLYPQGTPKEIPALILVSTDGYSNSFSTDEGFFKIGQDYRQMFKSNLTEEVRQKLEGFLQETSEKGSGDDITLGMIKRLETDDRDYLTDRVEDLDRKVILVEESNMRQQENISVFESKVKRLDNHQKKIDNKVVLVILGLIVTLPLSVISTALSVSLFFRLDGINAELKRQQQTENEMKLEINRIKIKQQPAKNTSEQSSFNRISTR
ncbi:MAG: PP2C family serine/threonine-protein phosphatase [Microcystis sp.]|jgi:serine/threonine protein phosphatase PrpC|uniref:Protein phosphatase 2C domain-containing protein n=1 Tax=Microcystis flos-aquae Mf_QC_C_20070823_S10D TaxID=2486236 RepID=A0A552L2Q9_9CHRO|nr:MULTISPECIES: PP2C family serine/threonine-protein phosphatase [unclassified Microcystis]MCA2815689.1 protein phosphatase 2C domain-containing protein [Microcystis sp. M085S1]MCA2855243.1 protein phosphatase 2C domain-containing protein [Microcystis sp. M065S1]MCZ8055035.1 PP2C family serine/threonine-protein phosphatase [Microcystis sp. LE19-12.2C]MDJ0550522.1 PP2C family serine/threonine-protein phosphatase [Microcystis sp. M49637_WE12]TRT78494.1 MAG: protein phosphatase 2C domain-contain